MHEREKFFQRVFQKYFLNILEKKNPQTNKIQFRAPFLIRAFIKEYADISLHLNAIFRF